MILAASNIDESWLAITRKWLTDPEIRRLTRTTATITGEGQRQGLQAIREADGYYAWGIEADGQRVGVFGVKNIAREDAELFVYIGERAWWGHGIVKWVLDSCVR